MAGSGGRGAGDHPLPSHFLKKRRNQDLFSKLISLVPAWIPPSPTRHTTTLFPRWWLSRPFPSHKCHVQQMIESEEENAEEEEEDEVTFLQSLSKKERKLLLNYFKKEEQKGDTKKRKRHSEHKRKKKKKKKKHSTSSSSSEGEHRANKASQGLSRSFVDTHTHTHTHHTHLHTV